MFFVDKPYVSDFFRQTVRDNALPVVATDFAENAGLYGGTAIIDKAETIERVRTAENPAMYMISENSIDWISKHLAFSGLPEKINLFKDKAKFRQLTRSMFPDFAFKAVRFEDLKAIDFDELPLPFIIKPAVGFFSMGVYQVTSHEEWLNTIDLIGEEMEQVRGLYPTEVLDTGSFIIEQYIQGDEFAVDAYFNSAGEAVVLGILEHTFSSDQDVSDRVYTTSKSVIEDNLAEFTEFTQQIGRLAGVKNFPVHIELRRGRDGTLLPIEVNPMRFGGWCTTADMTFMAYGFNPYLYYHSQLKPDWPNVLKGREGKIFSIIVLDNSTGLEASEIDSFDYEKLLSHFEKPLELRKIDFREYPLFGFLFTETREDNFSELKRILDSDLNEFVSGKAPGAGRESSAAALS